MHGAGRTSTGEADMQKWLHRNTKNGINGLRTPLKSTVAELCFKLPTQAGKPNHLYTRQSCTFYTPGCACMLGYPAVDESLSEGISQLPLGALVEEAEKGIWLGKIFPEELVGGSNNLTSNEDVGQLCADTQVYNQEDDFGSEKHTANELNGTLDSHSTDDNGEGDIEDEVRSGEIGEDQGGDDEHNDEKEYIPEAQNVLTSKHNSIKIIDSTSYDKPKGRDTSPTMKPSTSSGRVQTKFQILWIQIEKDTIGRLMREVINEGKITGTEERWKEVQVRLAGYEFCEHPRTWSAIKNYWNREGRAAHNLDERMRPRPDLMITGHKRNRNDMTEGMKRDRKKKRKQINTIGVKGEEAPGS